MGLGAGTGAKTGTNSEIYPSKYIPLIFCISKFFAFEILFYQRYNSGLSIYGKSFSRIIHYTAIIVRDVEKNPKPDF